MKLTGRNHVVTNKSIAETMRAFKRAGYDGMELSIARATTNLVTWDYLDDYIIDGIMAMSADLELPICSLSCHMNFITDDNVFEADKKMIKKAARYQTNTVIVSTPANIQLRENHPEGIYEKLTVRLKELCAIAEDSGVVIAVEPEPNHLLHNMTLFYECAERVNSPAMKLNLDIGHLYLSEPDLYKAIRDAAPFIAHSHIDNMCRGEHCHKLPWLGDIDLPRAYKAIRDTGFDGAVALDLYIQDYLAVSSACVTYLQEKVFAPLAPLT